MSDLLDPQAGALLVLALLAMLAFVRVLRGHNPVEAWHFYASKDQSGTQWGDPKKLAVMVYIFASTVFVGYAFWAHPVDLYMVALFCVWAVAMLGIDVFAAWARSFVDRRYGQRAAIVEGDRGAQDGRT